MSEATRDPRHVGATATSTVIISFALKYSDQLFGIYIEPGNEAEMFAAANVLNLSIGAKARDLRHQLEAVTEWSGLHKAAAAVVYPLAAIFG